MFRRTDRGRRSAKPRMRWVRPTPEQLEDRCLLAGITEFTAGITPAAAPTGIVNGPDGNLWFTEFGADRIGRITPNGAVTEFSLPAGRGPLSIVSGPDGNLWFTERNADRIGRLNPLAVSAAAIQASLVEFVVPGAGSAPAGITAGPDGALWFTEYNSDEIGRLTTAGVVTNEFPIPGPGASRPLTITVGPDGNLWFTEVMSDQIGRLTTTGALTEFGVPGAGSAPFGITSGPDGALWFTEMVSGQVGRITTGGVVTNEFTLPNRSVPEGITPGPDDRLYVAEAGLDRFARISPTGDVVEFAAGITPGSSPTAVTLGPDGNLWFTEALGNRIGELLPAVHLTAAASGNTVSVFGPSNALRGVLRPFGKRFHQGVRVAVGDVNGDGFDDVIVAQGGGGSRVLVFNGRSLRLLASFRAFGRQFQGGVVVATGDVNGDGRTDLVVGQAAGGGEARVFDGAAGGLLFRLKPFAGAAGLRVAAGDVNGDGRADVLVATTAGGRIKVFNGLTHGLHRVVTPFGRNAPAGLFVAAGDVNGDGFSDIIAGTGGRRSARVQVQSGKTGSLLLDLGSFGRKSQRGVVVAAGDVNSDGFADVLASLIGSPEYRAFSGQGGGLLLDRVLPGRGGVTPAGGLPLTLNDGGQEAVVPPPAANDPTRGAGSLYTFRSPSNANNSVLVLTANSFAGATTPATFDENRTFLLNIANHDLINTTDDVRYAVQFSPPAANLSQAVTLIKIDNGGAGVATRGVTNTNLPLGSPNALFRAGIQDDPFLFDAAGLNNVLLNRPTALTAIQAGQYPRGTSPNGFGPGSTPNFDAPNFFGPKVNTLAITLEVPSARLTAPGSNAIGVWGSTAINGIQVDRAGRPEIDTLLIPPVPRGSNFPILQPGPGVPQNRVDRRSAFNAGHPRDDRANFRADMISVLTAFWPAGRPGGNPSAAQAGVLADLLLPDILVFDVTNSGGFGTKLTVGGKTFLGNGRKLSDDVISAWLSVLTDDDLPAGFGGGPNPPLIVTQNVKDDNGQNLKDGSTEPPPPQGNGAAGTGTVRAAVFPYIGAPN